VVFALLPFWDLVGGLEDSHWPMIKGIWSIRRPTCCWCSMINLHSSKKPYSSIRNIPSASLNTNHYLQGCKCGRDHWRTFHNLSTINQDCYHLKNTWPFWKGATQIWCT
jgi:hypothetical protein